MVLVFDQTSHDTSTLGDYSFLLSYWGKLPQPVKWLLEYYRWLSHALFQAERLLVLFQTEPIVADVENAIAPATLSLLFHWSFVAELQACGAPDCWP
jgi:ABC-type multidrug transport system fused ATPase/permease subunit